MSSTFAALRHPDFRMLWLCQATSSFGDTMQQFAIGWLVVDLAVRAGEAQLAPFYIGLIGIVRGLPSIAFNLLGGVVADRMDRRRLLMATRIMGAYVALTLAILVLTDRIGIPQIMGLSVLSAVSDGFDSPTRQASVPRVVPADDLMSAQGLINSTFSSAAIFGPLIGGLLLVPLGVGGLMVVKSFVYVLAILALLRIPPLPPLPGVVHLNIARSLRDGVGYTLRDPILGWVMLGAMTISLFARPVQQLMPAIARNTLGVGAAELSWMLAATGVGGLVGTLFTASLGGVSRRGLMLICAMVAWASLLALFAVQRDFTFALLLVGIPSIAHFIFSGLSLVLCQMCPPDHLRARVISIYIITASAGGSIGALVLGSLGTLFGVNNAILIGSACIIAVAAFMLVRASRLRDLDARTLTPPELAPSSF